MTGLLLNKIIQEDLERIINTNLPWQTVAGQTILISGANGFLPAYMVKTLLYLNEKRVGNPTKVIGVVRNRDRALQRFAEYQGRDDFQMVIQDICDPLYISEKIDYVIHAASQASPKYYRKDPVGTLSANIIGTHNLLKLSLEKEVKGFLFFSSGEIYGQLDSPQIPTKEDTYGWVDPMDVRSCYAESKRMGETMCVSWAQQFGVPIKIARPFHTYGPGMSLDDGRVFADFVADIISGRDINMVSDGSALRAFCYLADAVEGFFTVLFRGEIGQAYNIGNDKCEISILGLANLLVGLFPEKGLKVVNVRRESGASYLESKITRNCPDITKAGKLGWFPTTSLAQGFVRTIRSFS
jgi:UDP-glucuronate decarboxylase